MNDKSRLEEARSFLFVPGNRPERFEKAARSGADVVILDLEDAVPATDKAGARQAVIAHWADLLALQVPLVVRVNAVGCDTWLEDLAALDKLPGLLEGVALLPLVESVAGFHAVRALAASPGVLRLAVGHIDFMADAGFACDERESELVPLRFAVAMATREAGLAPAIDGVTVQPSDEQQLREDTLRARRFGFGAKLCIHPRQVAIVHEALAPTDQEMEWANRVVAADEAAGGAAVQLDGRMVDLPVVLQARQTLARAVVNRVPKR
jgi:citrate lyase subunit beta/citryl-CoA lyase